MSKPTEHNAKTPTSSSAPAQAGAATGSAKAALPNAGTAASPPLPKSWSEIRVGSLVIAHEGLEEGWWEAVVTEVRDDVLTLRSRDYPKYPAIVRNRKEVALLLPGTEERPMRGQPAKVLAGGEVRRLLGAARQRRYPDRNRVIVLLSVKAGLRACEIARLTWPMVSEASGKIGTVIELPAKAAKKGSGRRIPIHPDLHRALVRLQRSRTENEAGRTDAVVRSERGGSMTAKAIVDWFADTFAALGLQGCSSHSGRRTFVTRAARLVQKAGGSLRDVQQLVGHRSIKTTQGYIDGDYDAQRRLIRLL